MVAETVAFGSSFLSSEAPSSTDEKAHHAAVSRVNASTHFKAEAKKNGGGGGETPCPGAG